MKIIIPFLLCFVLVSCNQNSKNLNSTNESSDNYSDVLSDDFSKFLENIPQINLPYNQTFKDSPLRKHYLKVDNSLVAAQKETVSFSSISNKKLDAKYIKIDTIKRSLNDKFIGSSLFARVPTWVTPLYKFKHKNTFAVIYESGSFSNREVRLQTFDNSGNKLASLSLKQSYTHFAKLSSINSNGIIEQKRYENIWKHDIEEVDTENNEISKRKLVDVHNYKISDDGKIEMIENHIKTNNLIP